MMWVHDLIEFFEKNCPPVPKHELHFLDHSTGRQAWMNEHVIDNMDVGAIKDCLENLSPEFRAFILKSAEMICEAGNDEH